MAGFQPIFSQNHNKTRIFNHTFQLYGSFRRTGATRVFKKRPEALPVLFLIRF